MVVKFNEPILLNNAFVFAEGLFADLWSEPEEMFNANLEDFTVVFPCSFGDKQNATVTDEVTEGHQRDAALFAHYSTCYTKFAPQRKKKHRPMAVAINPHTSFKKGTHPCGNTLFG